MMIFLRVALNNLYMFQDAAIDLTYPRKLKSSTVETEWLEDFPNINFKKVIVLSGANASGKTVFGKALGMINNYIAGRSIDQESTWLDIKKMIFEKKKSTSFDVEFITTENQQAHKLSVSFDKDGLVEESYRSVKLQVKESQSALFKRLRKADPVAYYHKKKDNHEIINAGFSSVAVVLGKMKIPSGWNYRLCELHNSSSKTGKISAKEPDIIRTFLSAFDSSITRVTRIASESYKIGFSNGEHVLIDKGILVNPDRLSRGTHEAIDLAMFYELMKSEKHDSATYYLDEMLAYSHTEAEQSILNLLIDILPRHAQLFYSTHNYDILDMNLPVHSHVFLKKDQFSEFIHPEKKGFNQNDRSLLGYVKNDVFGTLPDMDAINSL